ncbi:hypothetical protein MNBD_GAMMA04-1003, partial [hydrothermal vent metagenome]
MNVLSLFGGIECGRVALDRLNVKVGNYYSSEIDKYAIAIATSNYPDIIPLGDITRWRVWDEKVFNVDLILAGFPCQAWSLAGRQQGDNDPRGALIHDLISVWNKVKKANPNVKFLFENVKMKKEHLDYINDLFSIKPILINSALVSAQNRERLYWSSFKQHSQPVNKNILLKDILEPIVDCPIGIKVREKSKCLRVGGRNPPFGSKQEWDSPFQRISKKGTLKKGINKAGCLTAGGNSGGNHSDMDIIHGQHGTRRYSIKECERLQDLPEGYVNIAGVSKTQQYKAIGNGWTVGVIEHLLKEILSKG